MRLHKLNKLKKLKANRFGRDFIVGDLHGCYYELIELLNDVDFDFERLDNMVIIGYDIEYRLMDLFRMNKKLWLSIFNIDRISHCKT